ncbi:MAG: cupin domain-containing protein [Rubrivivax sp.]|nr:MAG: cupin domain-containing protein [Rubrivivax sp.]
MSSQRIFPSADFFQPRAVDQDPIRSVVTESPDGVVVAWHLLPGQSIAAHTHPKGHDHWVILGGQGLYRVDAAGEVREIKAGDIVVAPSGAVHGVLCIGDEPLRFISVVAPAEAGYALLEQPA